MLNAFHYFKHQIMAIWLVCVKHLSLLLEMIFNEALSTTRWQYQSQV
jgi:hypothetical protein